MWLAEVVQMWLNILLAVTTVVFAGLWLTMAIKCRRCRALMDKELKRIREHEESLARKVLEDCKHGR